MGNRVHLQTRAPDFPGDFPAVRVLDDYDTSPWLHLDLASAGNAPEQWIDRALDQFPEFADQVEQMAQGARHAYLDDADFDVADCLERYFQRQQAHATATRMDSQLPASTASTRARI